jgi:hypothetical protein
MGKSFIKVFFFVKSSNLNLLEKLFPTTAEPSQLFFATEPKAEPNADFKEEVELSLLEILEHLPDPLESIGSLSIKKLLPE